VSIAPELLREYPAMNGAQREIVAHDEGPLLVIAGPGSGKTFSLVLRAVNLLVGGKAQPRELVLCTFTEKAAFELRDRLSAAARRVGYNADLSELQVGTIHGLCHGILTEHRHRTSLGSGYETLDELTQPLFIFDHFDAIIGPPENGAFLNRWHTRWTAIDGARGYFNKITEELVNPAGLQAAASPFLAAIGNAYLAYEAALFASNRIDFAHLQKLVHGLLADPEIGPGIVARFKYVLVDEYQDTNYVQEQILLRLAAAGNICVVGDEDQSLYRFRGATVRNILEFPDRFPGCRVVKLTTNYRSHPRIVHAYDRWMVSADWSNAHGRPFRYDKTIEPDPDAPQPEYPGIFSIWGTNDRDEAGRFADMVAYLKTNNVIEDYSQVALLLHSVRVEHSGPYLRALAAKGIRAFCPRARSYFDNEEVRLMIGCLALILGYFGPGRGTLGSPALVQLGQYVDECIVALARSYAPPHPVALAVQKWKAEIDALRDGEALDYRPADYLYRLLAFEPFAGFVVDENRSRNLAILSQLLTTFQNYYHYGAVTHRNREWVRIQLFNSFLRLLHEGGINEYEDPEQPFPKGHVQVMTIHQAKGLEFPVVAVGSLDKQLSSPKGIDHDLQPFYQRAAYEPENRITEFDRMRLHYVAFSRPEKVLVLTSSTQPKAYFAPIWQGLPQWPYVQQELLAAQRFELRERMPVKHAFSFTGDLTVYETCPRQYQLFREYKFSPSRSPVIFFGLLVHQTIEEVHRIVLDGKVATLDEERIRALFDRTFGFLSQAAAVPISERQREAAFRQIMDYFRENRSEMDRVIETEVDVSVEKEDYILTGKIDLLLGGDGKLELLDFKTLRRPAPPQHAIVRRYERQLCTYAHILEQRYGKRPDRLLLYWTGERRRKDALMVFPYRPEEVEAAGAHFDAVVGKIRAGDFTVPVPPEPKVCDECDFKRYCVSQHFIADGLVAP